MGGSDRGRENPVACGRDTDCAGRTSGGADGTVFESY